MKPSEVDSGGCDVCVLDVGGGGGGGGGDEVVAVVGGGGGSSVVDGVVEGLVVGNNTREENNEVGKGVVGMAEVCDGTDPLEGKLVAGCVGVEVAVAVRVTVTVVSELPCATVVVLL